MIIANPIYDSVFRVLMADLEIAKGVLSALISARVVELQMSQQEYVHRHPESGALAGIRLDFHAVIETEGGRRFSVIIELQKANLDSSALRFRRYLASQYQSRCDTGVASDSPACLPIISIYLLGYELDAELPMVTHVAREYKNAVTEDVLSSEIQRAEKFIELLTHDAYFVQIPKIKGRQGTELERVLSVFDQQRKLTDDDHRLEIDSDSGDDPLITKMYRCLNEAQEDPDIEAAMKLEDQFLEEQQVAIAEISAKLEEETRKRQEETRKRQGETRKLEEETRKRQEAEAEIERLKKLFEKD